MSFRRLPVTAAVAAAALVAWLVAWASPAWAGPRADIQKRMSAAMESYDLIEYETAKKLLLSALEIAKEGKLEDDPITAKVYLSLGIVYFAGLQDKAAARKAFIEAVIIDPTVTLDPAYKTPDMSTLLETVRAASSGARPVPDRPSGNGNNGNSGNNGNNGNGGSDGRVDCFTISGLQHRQVERARRGAAQRISASLGGDVQASKVSVFVRSLRSPEFLEIRLTRDRECTYSGTINGNLMAGDIVHYYVAAVNSAGTVVASSGAAGAPNLIEMFGAAGEGERDENPLIVDPEQPVREPQPSVFERAPERPAGQPGARKLALGMGVASGLGYVTGETEQQRNKVQCCIAPGWLTLSAELGYALSPRLTLGGAVRLGFPLGANLEGHSPLGPAAFVRLRYALSPSAGTGGSGGGLRLMGQLGGGIIRDTVKLSADGVIDGMDTDIVALGPVLFGGGIGYGAALTPMVALTFDLNAIAGIPVVSELGTSKLNFGIQLDATIGAALRF